MIRRKIYLSALCGAALALFLFAGDGLSGQIPKKIPPLKPNVETKTETKPVATAAVVDKHDLTPEDISAFLDGFVPLQLQRENIAGSVILVVKDGKVLYQRGFGYADVEKRTPVSPSGILFRPGSISKLFTWTAVMQMVEEGKINLDENINTYLDFKIPDKFAKPITMRHLMTHTAGFEESIKDLIIQENAPPSLRAYLVNHMPERVYAPGTTPAYSNYGATLAGYIVQRVSGVAFDDYVEQHIFTPLGMTHSTFRQPLPAALKPMMSEGYALASDPAKPFEVISAEPAGSMSVTAEDIAHFMLAHLQEGQYQGTRILNPATMTLMHSAQFALHPALPHGLGQVFGKMLLDHPEMAAAFSSIGGWTTKYFGNKMRYMNLMCSRHVLKHRFEQRIEQHFFVKHICECFKSFHATGPFIQAGDLFFFFLLLHSAIYS